MPIKTLHITNYYHSTSGGIRTFYRALLEAANVHRREVRLIVPGPEQSVENVGDFGRIYTLTAPRSPFFDPRYRLLFPHLYALPYRSALKKILSTEQPDLVEICDKYTLCYLPSVLRKGWVRGTRPSAVVGLSCERMDDNISAFVSSGKVARRFSNWYMKKIYGPRFDHHISNSEYTAEELWRALAMRPDLQVHVCPMGVDAEFYSPRRRSESRRSSLLALFPNSGVQKGRVRLLLCVCRISPEKNVGLLPQMMEALGSHPGEEYCLLIAGAGPSFREFSEIAARSALGRVRLLGHVGDRERLADIYANCDALVHPNPREPLGLVPLEAMASGLPVVVPRSGGVLSYAQAENSWLAAPAAVSFSEAVQQVFQNDGMREKRIERALATARQFSWPIVTGRYFDLYDRIVAARRHTQLDRPLEGHPALPAICHSGI